MCKASLRARGGAPPNARRHRLAGGLRGFLGDGPVLAPAIPPGLPGARGRKASPACRRVA